VKPKYNEVPVLAVVGPTASGKSALGIELAQRFRGEIINCDSVQVYSGIEIATAKVPLAERQGIAHHLIDFVPPNINYTAGEWVREAVRTIAEIESRGRIPILVGGTGFYLRALRQPFFSSPATNEDLRRRLSQIRRERGAEYLHRILQRLDRKSALVLFPRDWPRVQRAIEFRVQTGRPMSEIRHERPLPPDSVRRLSLIGLNPPRAELYRRINERTESHFSAGLVDEVKMLLARGVPADGNALGAHGYRRVVEYLQGKRDVSSAIEQTKLAGRHYAKRQLTWFRRELGLVWFEGFGEERSIQERVVTHFESSLFTKRE
jgi:tRNA dimethylallyltransferase